MRKINVIPEDYTVFVYNGADITVFSIQATNPIEAMKKADFNGRIELVKGKLDMNQIISYMNKYKITNESVIIDSPNLMSCPFCNKPAEMMRKQTYCSTQSMHNVTDCDYRKYVKWIFTYRTYRDRETCEQVEYAQPFHIGYYEYGYVPRCTDPSCCGRSTKKFLSEQRAVEGWNRRF